MNDLPGRAKQILEAAVAADAESSETAIVLDRSGNLRIVNSEGWTLPGIVREFGAAEVFVVKKRALEVMVEGWSRADRCLVTTSRPHPATRGCKPACPSEAHAARLQVTPQLLA